MTQAKLRAVVDDIKQYFVSRDDEIEYLAVMAVAREHAIFHGPPGCAKSDLVLEFSKRVTASNFFYKQLSADMARADLLGPISVKGLLDDRYRYLTKGYLADAHFAVLDELPRASGVLLDDMLSVLNERVFVNGDITERCPLVSAMATANTKLTGQHAANADRWLFRFFLDYLQSEQERQALDALDIACFERNVNATIDLQDLADLHEMIPTVKVATEDAVWEAKRELIKAFHAEGMIISDRRFRKINNAVAAHAIVQGREAAELSDLDVLVYIVPDNAEQVPRVRQLVAKVANPYKERVTEILQIILQSYNNKLEPLLRNPGSADRDLRLRLAQEIYDKTKIGLQELAEIAVKAPNEASVVHGQKVLRDIQQDCLKRGIGYNQGTTGYEQQRSDGKAMAKKVLKRPVVPNPGTGVPSDIPW